MPAALLLLATGCGPDLTERDRAFANNLANLLAQHDFGPVEPAPGILRSLFGRDVETICIVSGGDWATDVRTQWRNDEAAMPIPVERLRDAGSGDLSYDGLVAVVGIDGTRKGWVRRGWFGDSMCSDHGETACWRADQLSLEIVKGPAFDAGPHAGETMKALQLVDKSSRARSCSLLDFR